MSEPSFERDAAYWTSCGYAYLLGMLTAPASKRHAFLMLANLCFESADRNFRFSKVK